MEMFKGNICMRIASASKLWICSPNIIFGFYIHMRQQCNLFLSRFVLWAVSLSAIKRCNCWWVSTTVSLIVTHRLLTTVLQNNISSSYKIFFDCYESSQHNIYVSETNCFLLSLMKEAVCFQNVCIELSILCQWKKFL